MTKYDDVKPITSEERKEVRNHIEFLRQRAERAKQRQNAGKPGSYYFAISGRISVPGGQPLFIGEILGNRQVFIQPVEETPLATEVYGAIKDSYLVPFVLNHAPFIQSEFVIEDAISLDEESLWTMIGVIASATQLYLRTPVCIPIAADFSWGTLAAHDQPSVTATLTKRGLYGGIPFSNKMIDAAGAKRVGEYANVIQALEDDRRLKIAIHSLDSAIEATDKRVSIAAAWAGIESIFGISSELRFRIAAYVATLLKTGAAERLAEFRSLQKLYDRRSKAIHGGQMSETDLSDACNRSIGLLIDIIVRIFELRRVPTTSEFDEILFSTQGAT